MKALKKTLLVGGCALLPLGWATANTAISADKEEYASSETQSGPGIVIKDFQGIIEISFGGTSPQISLSGDQSRMPLRQSRNDGVLTVSGPERLKNFNFYGHDGWREWRDSGNTTVERMRNYLEDYPVMQVQLPEGSDVTVKRTVTILTADDGVDALHLGSGPILANIGDVNSAKISASSFADVTVGNIAGELRVSLSGSADVVAGSSGTADVSVSGSGDLEMGPVRGDADYSVSGSGDVLGRTIGGKLKASVSGSGDVELGKVSNHTRLSISGSGDMIIGDIEGELDASVSGSGDIEIGDVTGAAELRSAGSGDIEMDSINGPANVMIAGNSSVEIDGGVAEDLRVAVSGNGDFSHSGQSTNLHASVNGSGSIIVAKNTGTLRTSGRNGTIRVNGKKIDNKSKTRY